jgi:type IV secretory pathway VirD2 relaxase
MRATMSRAVDAHLRYLERDGVTRDGERGRAYSAFENEVDGKAFVERGREDRHQFRFIVAPEDAGEMADFRGVTGDLMHQMELDLATRLDWIAVDHHNTGHPPLTSSSVACSMTAASSISPATISPMASATPGN